MWDATYSDTFAQSYRAHVTIESGKVERSARQRNKRSPPTLTNSHQDSKEQTVGPKSLKEIGHCIAAESGDPKSTRLPDTVALFIPVQRGNGVHPGQASAGNLVSVPLIKLLI